MSLVNMAQGQKTLGGVFKERENNDDFQASGLGNQVDIKLLIEQIQQEVYEVLGDKEGERKKGREEEIVRPRSPTNHQN